MINSMVTEDGLMGVPDVAINTCADNAASRIPPDGQESAALLKHAEMQ